MFTWIDHAFWATEVLGFMCVLALVARERALLRWWSVTAFCVLQVSVNICLAFFYARQNWPAYFYLQWYSEVVFDLAKIAILWQVVLAAISSIGMVHGAPRRWFALAVLGMACASFAFGVHGFSTSLNLSTKALLFNRATSMAVVAVFATFAVFSSVFALKWKPRGLRIDMGLNIIAVVDPLCFIIETSTKIDLAVSYRFQSSCHIASICFWCSAFALPDSSPRLALDELRNIGRKIGISLPQSQRGVS